MRAYIAIVIAVALVTSSFTRVTAADLRYYPRQPPEKTLPIIPNYMIVDGQGSRGTELHNVELILKEVTPGHIYWNASFIYHNYTENDKPSGGYLGGAFLYIDLADAQGNIIIPNAITIAVPRMHCTRNPSWPPYNHSDYFNTTDTTLFSSIGSMKLRDSRVFGYQGPC